MAILKKLSLSATIILMVSTIVSFQTKNIKSTAHITDSITKISYSAGLLFSDSLPQPHGYVNDYENLYNVAEEATLDSLIHDFENRTTIQIALVTFATTMTTKDSVDDLTYRIAKFWRVGQKGKDNGIVIGICRGYRKIRIENGQGIEKFLTNEETRKIIDTEFIPKFKTGEYFEGTLNGLKALMTALGKNSAERGKLKS